MFRTHMSAVMVVILLAGSAGATAAEPSVAPASPRANTSPSEAVPGAVPTPPAGELLTGRYFTAQGDWTPVTFSYQVAAPGWFAQNGGQTISKRVDDSAHEISWSVEILDSLFATPCGADDRVPLGPAVSDLVAGLQGLPDVDASEPTQLMIDGRAGQLLELALPDGLTEASCDPPIGIQVWLDQAGGKYLVVGESHTSRVYSVDVDGARFVLNVNIATTADPADVAEFEAILASITFHP